MKLIAIILSFFTIFTQLYSNYIISDAIILNEGKTSNAILANLQKDENSNSLVFYISTSRHSEHGDVLYDYKLVKVNYEITDSGITIKQEEEYVAPFRNRWPKLKYDSWKYLSTQPVVFDYTTQFKFQSIKISEEMRIFVTRQLFKSTARILTSGGDTYAGIDCVAKIDDYNYIFFCSTNNIGVNCVKSAFIVKILN